MHIGYWTRQRHDRWGFPQLTEAKELVEVANKTGGTLTKATLVYVNGYDATLVAPTVAKADSDAGLFAEYVLSGAIATNAKGIAMLVGQIGGQNTNAATVGDPVYLSDTAGAWTLAAPAGADKAVQVVGVVQKKSATVGVIQFTLGRKSFAQIGTSQLLDDSVTPAKTNTATAGVAEASKIAVLGATKNLDTICVAQDGFKMGASGAEVAVEATPAEINKVHDATAGTPVASKVVIADANQNIGVIKGTALHLGTSGSETQVTASAAELNYNDRTGAVGVAEASKTAVLGTDKNIDELHTAALYLGSAAGTLVGATAAEINAAVDFSVSHIYYWNPAAETLQAVITGITTATADNQYTIIVPPGHRTEAELGTTPVLLKPFVNLKGAGGRGRITVFHNMGFSLLDAAMTTGTQRFRADGIRFETCPLIFTAASHVMSVILDDCPINNASSIAFTGTSYASRSALEIRNLNIDRNTSAMLYKFANVSFWNSTLLGLYFEDADAYFFGCDISAGANCVNAGTAGGWFEFNHCKIDQMTVGDPASVSVLETFGVGGSENIQIHGQFVGETAPGSVAGFIRMRAGTEYFCHNDLKKYVKTADVGTNTWAVVGAQA